MTETSLQIQVVDPQGVDALMLLHEAAMEARELYPELHDPNTPLPINPPASPRGRYLLAYDGPQPVGSGTLRLIDESTVEIRRMYVLQRVSATWRGKDNPGSPGTGSRPPPIYFDATGNRESTGGGHPIV